MIKKYNSNDLQKIYFSCTNKNTYEAYKKLSEDYKDIEFSLEMIEQYKKMDKYTISEVNICSEQKEWRWMSYVAFFDG